MATKKTTPKSKSAATKAKRPTATKSTRAANTRKAPSRKKQVKTQSFKLAKSDRPFLSFNPTVQTVYWIILGVIVIAFTAWIMKLQADINTIYDQIDTNDSIIIEEPSTKKEQSQN